MAFRFNAIFKFGGTEAARGKMDQTKSKFKAMRESIGKDARMMGAGLQKMNQGIRGLALGTAPFAAGVAGATKVAADFEAQMSTVQSVLLFTKDEMKPLNDLTKRLGATTAFTAKQAGEGAEMLARAGFTSEQIISALPGVLDAAAASGVSLAEASDVVASTLGAFNLEASRASEVADSLSLTTALTNTSFTQLAEGMKFAAPFAKQAGITFSETASALGVFANAGVKGSLGGTALKNALLKLSKPSEEALKLFGGKDGLNDAVMMIGKDGKQQLRPMEVIMANIAKVIEKSDNRLEAAGKAAEIFGLRGTTAFSSFQAQLTKQVPVTDKLREQLVKFGKLNPTEDMTQYLDQQTIPKLVALRVQIAMAEGTAAEMAKIRLDNLLGQFTLFQSAVSGLSIEMGSFVTGPIQAALKTATDFISVMATGFQTLEAGGVATWDQMKALEGNPFRPYLNDMIEFAQGFKEGFLEVKDAVVEFFTSVKEGFQEFAGESGMTMKEIGKLAAKIIIIGAIAAPVFASIAAAAFVLGPIISGIVGAFQFLWGAISALWSLATVVFPAIGTAIAFLGWPITLVILAVVGLVAAFWYFWDEIKAGALYAWEWIKSAFEPVMPLFKFIAAIASVAWNDMIRGFTIFGNWVLSGLSDIGEFFSVLWTTMTENASFAFNALMEVISPFLNWITSAFAAVGTTILDAITLPFRTAISIVKGIVSKIADSAIGKKALSVAGIDAAELNASLANLPGVSAIDKFTGVKKGDITAADFAPEVVKFGAEQVGVNIPGMSEAAAGETTRQKVLSQPPSAAETGNATIQAIKASGIGGPAKAEVNVNLKAKTETKIRGKDLNVLTTIEQIDQAEKNGRTFPAGAKYRARTNGQMITGMVG